MIRSTTCFSVSLAALELNVRQIMNVTFICKCVDPLQGLKGLQKSRGHQSAEIEC
jgi:hypothetical protein